METTLGTPSMRSKYSSPPIGFYVIVAIILGIALGGLPFYTPVNKWLRETFGKCFSGISSCLRICACGSGEANERGADAREQIEINDLVNDQLDIHPQPNGDNLGPHGDPQPELLMGMRELQNNLINLHPDGDISGEHRIKGLPDVLAEVRISMNNLENRPNGDVCGSQEHLL